MTIRDTSGSEALAYGALDAGVQFVTGYPGSPSTATLEALLRLAGDAVRVEWAINEKSAFDSAFGASLARIRSLLCVKSVGLNVALDSLMVANLAAGDGGFVILTGDDPGGWGSQNEQDSRPLVVAAEVPLLEPASVLEARSILRWAFELSERFQVPVVVRITQALAAGRTDACPPEVLARTQRIARFVRQGDRFNILPIHVVDYHRRLQATIRRVQSEFEASPWNVDSQHANGGLLGDVRKGLLASGYTHHKIADVLARSGPAPVRILRLSTLYPLPEARIAAYLRDLDEVLVVEETAPLIETYVQALAQRVGVPTRIYGRTSNHLPGAGELAAHHIANALAALLPDWPWPTFESAGRTMPSRQPLCDGCPYVPMAQALLDVMDAHGGRAAFAVTGETGCIVRAQLPPWELLDVKYAMGSSIGLAAGLARAGIDQTIIALTGDSAFLHSGLGELIDTAQAGLRILVVVLDNGTTALSGGQPHPATDYALQGRVRQPVDLAALVLAAGAGAARVVDPADSPSIRSAFEEALASEQLSVVIARHPCPRWARSDAS